MQFIEQDDESEHALHSAAERAAVASRSTWVSVVVNVVLSTVQIVVGIAAKSQGLVADGIHSLSDLVADFVVLFAGHHGQKDADTDHPYGHYRFETAASLALGVILLAVGLGMVWSAFVKLQTPDTIATAHATALWVALAAIVLSWLAEIAAQVGTFGPGGELSLWGVQVAVAQSAVVVTGLVVGLGLIALAASGTVGAWGWIGVVPVLTGLFKFCPAYTLLGFSTCPMKAK